MLFTLWAVSSCEVILEGVTAPRGLTGATVHHAKKSTAKRQSRHPVQILELQSCVLTVESGGLGRGGGA